MAYQHFYSRVPARISMYNRTDGYDTFAKSREISDEYVEKELSAVCDYRPTKNELSLIRDGKLSPVYCHYTAKSDSRLIQSCITYLPKDYTGERSSCMIHSLLLDENDAYKVCHGEDTALLNPDMFVKDIERFDITAATAKPINGYPAVEYLPARAKSPAVLPQTMKPICLKRLIHTLLLTAHSKAKPIYITMQCPLSEFSSRCLEFMNSLLSIFPKSIRTKISFITYQSDFTKFSSFKVRFMPAECMTMPSGKGYTFDMSGRIADGVSETEYNENRSSVEFFYSLCGNEELRRSFHAFCDEAEKADPTLSEPSAKVMRSLVFLYRASCGLFPEKEVLPDDSAVYDIITQYEKYRKALPIEARRRIVSCLERYPASHTQIPQNIFGKLCRMYPSEPEAVKEVEMGIVLELLHSDVMNNKLFAFIKSNYDGEPPKRRDDICGDLAKLFYGGFLKTQILSFFSRYFPTESQKTRDLIIDKLLLSIRTPEVSDGILEFIACYYDSFSPQQKEKLYATFYEMIPECDELSAKVVALINANAEKEENVGAISERLLELLDMDQKKKCRRLLRIYMNGGEFFERITLTKIFFDWYSRRILLDYTDMVAESGSISRVVEKAARVFSVVPYMSAPAAKRFCACLEESVSGAVKKSCNLYDFIDAEKQLSLALLGKFSAEADKFYSRFSREVLRPLISASLYDAFKVKYRSDGVEFVCRYAQSAEGSFIVGSSEFYTISSFDAMKRAVKEGSFDRVIAFYMSVPAIKTLRSDIYQLIASQDFGSYIPGGQLSENRQVRCAAALLFSLAGTLVSEKLSFRLAYDRLVSLSAMTGAASDSTRALSLSGVIEAGAIIRRSSLSDEIKAQVLKPREDGSELCQVISSAIPSIKKSGRKAIGVLLTEIQKNDREFAEFIKKAIKDAGKSSGGGIFSKLFSGK